MALDQSHQDEAVAARALVDARADEEEAVAHELEGDPRRDPTAIHLGVDVRQRRDQEGGDEDDELRAAEEGAPHVPRLEEVDHRPQEEDRVEHVQLVVPLDAHLHKQVERVGVRFRWRRGVGVAKALRVASHRELARERLRVDAREREREDHEREPQVDERADELWAQREHGLARHRQHEHQHDHREAAEDGALPVDREPQVEAAVEVLGAEEAARR